MAKKEADFGGLFEGVSLSEPLDTFKDNTLALTDILSIGSEGIKTRIEKVNQLLLRAEELTDSARDIMRKSEQTDSEKVRRLEQEAQRRMKEVDSLYREASKWPKTMKKALQLLAPICFVYLVTIWDAFVLDTARRILQVHPQYLLSTSTSDSEINKASLWNANTIEEVRSLMIDDQVRKLDSDRGKLAQVFEDYWGIEWGESGVSLDSVKEINARRDIWVHNKGLINQQYLNMVKEDNSSKLGEVAEITEEYLIRAIGILAGLAIYIHKVACDKHYAGTDCS